VFHDDVLPESAFNQLRSAIEVAFPGCEMRFKDKHGIKLVAGLEAMWEEPMPTWEVEVEAETDEEAQRVANDDHVRDFVYGLEDQCREPIEIENYDFREVRRDEG
jgi:hypothetical protein